MTTWYLREEEKAVVFSVLKRGTRKWWWMVRKALQKKRRKLASKTGGFHLVVHRRDLGKHSARGSVKPRSEKILNEKSPSVLSRRGFLTE